MNRSSKGLLLVALTASTFSLNAMFQSQKPWKKQEIVRSQKDNMVDSELKAVWELIFCPSCRSKGTSELSQYKDAERIWHQMSSVGKVGIKQELYGNGTHLFFMKAVGEFCQSVAREAKEAEKYGQKSLNFDSLVNDWLYKVDVSYYEKLYPQFFANMRSLTRKSRKKTDKKYVNYENDEYDGYGTGDEGNNKVQTPLKSYGFSNNDDLDGYMTQ